MQKHEELVFQYKKEPALRVFDRTASYYGFNKFAICSFPCCSDQPVPLALSEHWPMEWCQDYLDKGSFRNDPIMQYDRTYRVELFHWHQATDSFANSPGAHEIMTQRLDHGVGHGCSIPLSLPEGNHISVHMASDDEIELSQADQDVIVIAAQMLAGIIADNPNSPKHQLKLTNMEKEVLIWASMGKSATEISEVMRLPDNVITYHLEKARHKLGAANWTHAVVLALQQDLITI